MRRRNFPSRWRAQQTLCGGYLKDKDGARSGEADLAFVIVDNGVRLYFDHHSGLVQAAFNAASYRINVFEDFAMGTDETRAVIFQAGDIGAGADHVIEVGADGLQRVFDAA